jgi:hypothetical protein
VNKLCLILLILLVAVTAVCAQPVGSAANDSKIMVINACPKAIFIQFVTATNEVIFETDAIAPNDITRMFSTLENGFYFVNFKYNDADDWTAFYDFYEDDDYLVQLKAGLVCAIIIDANGEIDEHSLVMPDTTLPVVCFCNISTTELTRMEIGTDYMNEFVAFSSDVETLGMTDFTTVDAGNYGLSWESVASSAKGEYTWLPNENDKSLRLLPFETNNIYVFCVFKTDATDATLFNITP